MEPPTAAKLQCPVCAGTGYADSEARRMSVGMCKWIERGCRLCHASGWVTAARLAAWQADAPRRAKVGRKQR